MTKRTNPTRWTPMEFDECMKQTIKDIKEIFEL